jgi:23S rRNA (adenine2503-C2)-methyltransferase
MEDLKSKNLEEITGIGEELGLPKFKSKEIFRFIHGKLKNNIEEIMPLSRKEKDALKQGHYISGITPKKLLSGSGSKKVAFELEDGKVIESVLMEYEEGRKTLCISCQVGCPVACLFCATGTMGFKRNLSAGEILSQVYYFARIDKISNIVFMGMGEPFLNYDNVLKAAKMLNHPLGQNISARKIVISTIGIASGIKKLSEEKEQFRLAWSLVSPSDRIRGELIPLKTLEPISKVVQAIKEYQKATKRRITIEYVVLKGMNDSKEDAKKLIRISRSLDSHMNLIPYNPSPALPFSAGDIDLLGKKLSKARINVTVRKSLGKDIQAACGQLCDA